MKEFWNNIYKKKEYAYGKEPNKYFKKEIDKINPGKILLAAEGEGRNAVYAASIGWEVYAYDFSEFAYQKAVSLAKEKNVKINYQIGSLSDLNFDENYFDVIGLIFVHFPDSIRHKNHKVLSDLLKQEGNIIMEAFSNNHLKYQLINPNIGGPKNSDQLYSENKLKNDFTGFKFKTLKEEEIFLNEGECHNGKTKVMRMNAIKII